MGGAGSSWSLGLEYHNDHGDFQQGFVRHIFTPSALPPISEKLGFPWVPPWPPSVKNFRTPLALASPAHTSNFSEHLHLDGPQVPQIQRDGPELIAFSQTYSFSQLFHFCSWYHNHSLHHKGIIPLLRLSRGSSPFHSCTLQLR